MKTPLVLMRRTQTLYPTNCCCDDFLYKERHHLEKCSHSRKKNAKSSEDLSLLIAIIFYSQVKRNSFGMKLRSRGCSTCGYCGYGTPGRFSRSSQHTVVLPLEIVSAGTHPKAGWSYGNWLALPPSIQPAS